MLWHYSLLWYSTLRLNSLLKLNATAVEYAFVDIFVFLKIQIHTLVESLKLSITDQQLPMFIRIMQLGIALYYGEIGNFKDGETEESACHNKDVLGNVTGKYNKKFILQLLSYSVFFIVKLKELQC